MTRKMMENEENWNSIDNLPPSTLLGYDIDDKENSMKYEISNQTIYYLDNSIFIDFI